MADGIDVQQARNTIEALTTTGQAWRDDPSPRNMELLKTAIANVVTLLEQRIDSDLAREFRDAAEILRRSVERRGEYFQTLLATRTPMDEDFNRALEADHVAALEAFGVIAVRATLALRTAGGR